MLYTCMSKYMVLSLVSSYLMLFLISIFITGGGAVCLMLATQSLSHFYLNFSSAVFIQTIILCWLYLYQNACCSKIS